MNQAQTTNGSIGQEARTFASRPDVEQLAPALGAEIKGIDLSRGIDKAGIDFIRDVLHRYSVVVLRGQKLTPATQVAFGQGLGELRVSFFNDFAVENVPELTVVSNIQVNGKPIGLMDAGALWHTDGSYLSRPDMYTILYSIEVPRKDGEALGDTMFVSTAEAFDALPSELKEKVSGLTAIHSIVTNVERKAQKNLKAPPISDKLRNDYPEVEHPIVRRHPITGRKCLFVTEGHTKTIAGVPEEEGKELLDALCRHIAKPEFMYTHKWEEGDLLIWDNCATQHLAVTDYGSIPRRLHRAGILGPVPV